MFESNRHGDFRPLELPPKSDGSERSANQHGYIAPDGSEWSVIIAMGDARSTVPGAAVDHFSLNLTIAPREDGKTRTVGGAPLVRPVHEIAIQMEHQLENEQFDIEATIEDAVATLTEQAIVGIAKQADTFEKLARLGVALPVQVEFVETKTALTSPALVELPESQIPQEEGR